MWRGGMRRQCGAPDKLTDSKLRERHHFRAPAKSVDGQTHQTRRVIPEDVVPRPVVLELHDLCGIDAPGISPSMPKLLGRWMISFRLWWSKSTAQ